MRETVRRRCVALVLAGALLFSLSPSLRADPPTRYLDEVFAEFTVTSDLVYGHARNDQGELETLKLDVYEPEGDELARRPVFVWAHGGSLVGGDKADGLERTFGAAFAKRGWVFVSINYRLMSKFYPGDCPNDIVCATSPFLPLRLRDAQHDMQAAVRWVRRHATDLRANTNEITTGGHSAGTTPALLTAFAPDDPGTSGNPGYPSNVAAAMTHSGTVLEPSKIGPNEPPILMFNSVDDADLTLWVALAMTCLPTTLWLNDCELHAYENGGHGLRVHEDEIIQKTSEFFCRRVIAGCSIEPREATSFVGPSGSTWASEVDCAPAADAVLSAPLTLYAGPRGLELCSDGELGPLQGRAYIDVDEDGTLDYLQIDGDSDNPLFGGSLHIPADPVVLAQELADLILDNLPI
jgi:hypothetical protein